MIRNPIVPGYSPDPTICRVGDTFYLAHSSCEYFPGVPIRQSRDLQNWNFVANGIGQIEQLNLSKTKSSQGIYAPTLRHHQGRFYIVTTDVGGIGNFVIHADDIRGPWSNPFPVEIDGIDPSLFWDEDGRCYLTCQSSLGIRQVEFNPDTGQIIGDPKVIWQGTGGQWPEGPHVFRRGDYYYLTIAEGGTEYMHMQTIARSQSLWGPFEGCPRNPILTHRSLPHAVHAIGHCDFVDDLDGNWWAVCLGIRPNGYPPVHHLGRETFLVPVVWDSEGWPILGEGGTVPFDPKTASGCSWFDDFDKPLSGEWRHIRTPNKVNYSLSERAGYLTLTGTKIGLGDVGSPTWIGRPLCDFNTRFETLFDATLEPGDEAGVSLRMNESHRYEFFVTTAGIFVRQTIGELSQTDKVWDRSTEPTTRIRITADRDRFHFEVGVGKNFEVVTSAPTRYLGTEVAGGFTGVMIGLYVTSPTSSGYASFDWCRYESLI